MCSSNKVLHSYSYLKVLKNLEGAIFMMKKFFKQSNYRRRFSLFVVAAITVFATTYINIKPASAYTYPFTISHYIYNVGNAAMQQLGYNQPNTSGLVILDFGCSSYNSSTSSYGTQLVGGGAFVDQTTIANAVNQFIIGYNSNINHNQAIFVTVGASNDKSGAYPIPLTTACWNYSGKCWADMIQYGISQNRQGLACTCQGASDMELDWNTPSLTRAWVDGFSSEDVTDICVYDYGDNAGSYDNGSGMTYTDNRDNGWTTSDVWYVSYGCPWACAIPEIYYTSQANQWYHVSLWALNNQGGKIYFDGVMSEDGYGGTLGADASYNALMNALINGTQMPTLIDPTII